MSCPGRAPHSCRTHSGGVGRARGREVRYPDRRREQGETQLQARITPRCFGWNISATAALSGRSFREASVRLDRLSPLELLRLCTDVGSGFISPPSPLGFSAATHALRDEHTCDFARLWPHRHDSVGRSFSKNWPCVSVLP